MKTTKFKSSKVGSVPQEWDVRPFADSFTLMRNNTYTRENLTDLPGRVANVHYGDVLIKYGSVLDFARDEVPFLKPSVKANRDLLHNGDLIFADTAEDETVGKAVEIQGLNGKMAVSGLHTVACRPNENLFAPRYLGYYINSAAYHNQLLPLITGTKVSSVSRAGFTSTYVAVPPKPEQEKIAVALSDVDELLAAMTTQIEKKRAIKQGAMQELLEVRPTALTQRTQSAQRDAKCFSHGEHGEHGEEKTYAPRRRLAGFTGAWVEKRFDECFDIISNNTYAREFMCSDESGVANIHYGDVLIKYGSVLDFAKSHVESLRFSVLIKSENLTDGDLIIADTAEDETVGKAVEIQNLGARRVVAGLHTVACRPKMRFAPGWLGYYINSNDYHDQLLPLITGIKVSSISKTGFRQTILHLPILAEQQAIVGVLAEMDAEIAALEAKRAKYEQIKRGMMQELLTGKMRILI